MELLILSNPIPPPALPRVGVMPWWKRCVDLACCVLALPVLVAWVVVMAVVTALVSPGPIFFRQERVGLGGRRFNIFKFRTMSLGADTVVHQNHFRQLVVSNAPMSKLDARGDTRLIPGGWLLRASGLDELPQVINILLGDMTVVGPRPCIPSEFEQYCADQRERVNAVPGLTGLWQVSGKNRTTFAEMIQLDIQYSRRVSLPLDLKIILLTPLALGQQVYDTRLGRKSAVAFLKPAAVGATSRLGAMPESVSAVTL